MATEKLSIELEAKVGKYKTDLLDAQKALLKLENEALKAGGANKKMAAEISLAKNQVKLARNEYNMSTIALKQHAIQHMKTAGAVGKGARSYKKFNMAATQGAYAIDDLQYGFQGVQNNIQAMAVSLGASGGLIIGITLLVVGIGVLAKQFEKAQREAKKFKEALGEKQGLMATTLRHVEVVKTATKGTIAYKESLGILRKQGFDDTKESLEQYTDALAKHMLLEAKLEANADTIKSLLVDRMEAEEDAAKATRKNANMIKHLGANAPNVTGFGNIFGGTQPAADAAVKALAEVDAKLKKAIGTGAELEALFTRKKKDPKDGDKETDNTGEKDGVAYSHAFLGGMKKSMIGADVYSNLMSDIKNSLELMKAAGADNGALLASELEQLMAIDQTTIKLKEKAELMQRIEVLGLEIANLPPLMDNFVGLDAGSLALNKFKTDLASVKVMLDAGVISFDEYIKRVDTLTESYNKKTEATVKANEADQILTSSIAGLITGFAQAAGAGENIGDALLKGIGNTLMQLGSMLILTGLGVEAFKTALATLNGPVAVIAGAAMVAAGAMFSSMASKAGGGGGGSRGSGGGGGGSTSVVRPNPNRQGVKNRDSNLIIPMERLRYGLQGANDNYSGFN
mgnify:CR=1 FL=1|jgi:hypothetical protein